MVKKEDIRPNAFYMEPATGSVATGAEWLLDLATIDAIAELVGKDLGATDGESLVEVKWVGTGTMIFPQNRADMSTAGWEEV